MTSDACRELRGVLGAVALGNADDAEHVALRAHLDGCAECRAELRELTSVSAALPLADPARVAVTSMGLAEPPPTLAQRVLGRVTAERFARRARRRRRVGVVAAAATAVAAAIVAFALVVPVGSSTGTRVALSANVPGVSAEAILRGRAAGTEVAFHVAGLHQGEYYWLWVTGDDGDRVGAGTFQGTAKATDLVMTAALPLRDARRIWVTDGHDQVVLDERLPAPA
jgi:anti-sigma factor RsiW